MNTTALIPALGFIVVGAAMMFVVNNKTAQEHFVINSATQNRFLTAFGAIMGIGGVSLLFLVIAGVV